MPLHNNHGQVISPEAYKSQVLEQVAAALDDSLSTYMRAADLVLEVDSRRAIVEAKRGSVQGRSVQGRSVQGRSVQGRASRDRIRSALVAAFDQLGPQDLAALMISTLPVLDSANPLADRVGPCYDTKGVQTILGRKRGGTPVSKQAVEARRSRGTVLALNTSDDRWVYPLWQFDDGDVRRDVVKILSVFDRVMEPRGGLTSVAWSVASWFMTPAAALDGLKPEKWLAKEKPLREVEKLAGRTAGRWAA